ncbi:MAG: hypothetical protein GAK43_01869 [Stenotrophomonas maltophilia]|nr:MAG: hypothetical protein GAK43_01869 [Stenotrophomonas maltophilia]
MSRLAPNPALGAALILALGMGFGRFAFTGLYPLMVHEGVLSVASGSLAASANYAGYLLGALLLSRAAEHYAANLCRWALLGTLVCLAALALPLGAWGLAGVRLLAGGFSAVSLIGASTWLLHALQRHHDAPRLFAGVGVGILASAEVIALGNALHWSSALQWLLLAGLGLLVSAWLWPCLRTPPAAPQAEAAQVDAGPPGPAALPLLALYGLAGFGYIITATYLPLLVRDALGNIDPVQVWAAFGLGAAPSCFFWHRLHLRLGTRGALVLNLLVQALGVVLPALRHDAFSYLASALLVGGTFMGTVTIAMPAARRAARRVRFNMLAAMTAVYGVGQILGPLASSALFGLAQSFAPALAAAAAALVLAAGLACLPAESAGG